MTSILTSTSDPSTLIPSPSPSPSPTPATPPLTSYIAGFLLIGLAWGFTTPFIRRAALNHNPPPHPILSRKDIVDSRPFAWKLKVLGALLGLVDMLKDWRYALPLVINLTGSVWFFLLIGQAELSLTVPITNSMAFLFTVLGEWYVDKKMISSSTWFGMTLSLAGIALCVHSKL